MSTMRNAQIEVVVPHRKIRPFEFGAFMKNVGLFGFLLALLLLFCAPRLFPGTAQLSSPTGDYLLDGGSNNNWISASTESADHKVPRWVVYPSFSMERVRSHIEAMPGTKIITITDSYLHAEFRTTIFGFCDDIEVFWEPGGETVAFKGAARYGVNDLGVNKRRYEKLTKVLLKDQVIVSLEQRYVQ